MDDPTPTRLLAILLLAILTAGALLAQEDPAPYEPVHRDPVGTRLIDLPTPFAVGQRQIEVLFTHRFQQTVNQGSVHDLWGLDSGADVGIGVSAGVARNLDLEVYRSSFQEDFELAGKFLVIEQAPRVPLSLALRAGADLLQRSGVDDRRRPFGQLVVSRRFAPGVNLFLVPSWVRDTPRLRNAWNLPVGMTVPLPGNSLLEVEYVPKNRDLPESVAAWHAALSKSVGGHIFELVVGNSRATTVDQYLGGDSAAGFKAGDVRLGFNLVRDFNF
ncbi:MAG TPA: DUF5777 family beta-barrel protein [Thermoanaerobaculia bacterium]|nr:DUF5777 family beta-barrel protein [Thermoanaerobaculia bacterium]